MNIMAYPMQMYILNDDKEPVPEPDCMKWAEWFGDNNNRVMVQDLIIDDILISTIFLGLNNQWSPNKPPILFETMIFGGKLDGHREQWETYDVAMLGHDEAVQMVIESESFVHQTRVFIGKKKVLIEQFLESLFSF